MSESRNIRGTLLSGLVGLALLVGAAGLARYWMRTRPAAERRPEREMILPVRVAVAAAETVRLPVEAFGEIVPAQQVELSAEVAGRIVARSPRLEPGGRVAKDEPLFTLDPRDYEAAVTQAESNLERARVDLALERSRARVAAEEWRRMGGASAEADAESRSLALREPQVAAAESAVAAAEAALQRARLNLERTIVRAPFDAVVLERFAEVGQIAAPQTRLASLAAADAFYARVSLPAAHLRWVRAPDADGRGGAAARVIHETGGSETIERAGQVVRILGDLDPAGRLARALIRIEQPLEPPERALRLRAYVRAVIEGEPVPNVIRLPSTALREGGLVWVANGDDRLEIRPVTVLWQDREQCWITEGIAPGERIVLSRIGAPIPNLRLRIEGAEAEKKGRGERQAENGGRP